MKASKVARAGAQPSSRRVRALSSTLPVPPPSPTKRGIGFPAKRGARARGAADGLAAERRVVGGEVGGAGGAVGERGDDARRGVVVVHLVDQAVGALLHLAHVEPGVVRAALERVQPGEPHDGAAGGAHRLLGAQQLGRARGESPTGASSATRPPPSSAYTPADTLMKAKRPAPSHSCSAPATSPA